MITEAVLIAGVTVLGGIFVELIRARRRQDTVVDAVTPSSPESSDSMRDVLDHLIVDVRELRVEQNRHGNRLAGIEATIAERARRK